MTILIVCLAIVSLIAFVVLLVALRSGASDPGFQAGSEQAGRAESDDDDPRPGDETHAA